MDYKGKLYGKVGKGSYFDTGKTSDDLDQLEADHKELLESHEYIKKQNIEVHNEIKPLFQKIKKLESEKKELIEATEWENIFNAYGKPFTSGRDLWEWLKNNCKVMVKPNN